MSKDIEKIKKYLTNINLPEYESEEHRDKLRHQVINKTKRMTIMKNPIMKLAAAAVILIGISLLLTLFNKSITTPAYALDQTIEANNSIRSLHMRISQSKNDFYGSGESWVQCDDMGIVTNLFISLYGDVNEDDDQFRLTVWNEGIMKIWWPLRNVVYIGRTNENEMENELYEFTQKFNPKILFQRLDDESRVNKSIELNIYELAEDDDSIYVEVINVKNDTQEELIVDSKTKFVRQYTQRDLGDEQDVFDIKIEYLAYNQPIDKSIFQLNEIPDNAIVYDRTSQITGLEQGSLTDNEIAIEVVRTCLEAVIAKDYEEISRLMETKDGDSIEDILGERNTIEEFIQDEFDAELVSIVSIGQPEPHDLWPDTLCVPCEIEIEVDDEMRQIIKIVATAKPLDYQPGSRWIVSNEIYNYLGLTGLAQGDLTNDEIAIEVVRAGLEAAIAKDYAEASKLMGGDPGENIEEFFEEFFDARLLRIVSLGQPKPDDSFPWILCVPCEVEIENSEGQRWIVNITAPAKLVNNDHGLRWAMSAVFEIDPEDYPLKGIIIPGASVGEYQLGMSKDDVLERLGEPDNIFYGTVEYTLENLPKKYCLFFNDISFIINDGLVERITATSPAYKFTNGLGVGDTEESIIEVFGVDFQLKDMDARDFLSYEEKGLMFEINKENRTVMEINVSSSN